MFGESFLWVEKYRPQKIDDCVLSNQIKKTFSDIVDWDSFSFRADSQTS